MRNNISTPEKRNLTLNGKRTTLQLERYVWQNLDAIAHKTNQSAQDILDQIWLSKADMPMAPSVRLFLMLFYSHYADWFIRPYQDAPLQDGPYKEGSAVHAAESPLDYAQQSTDHAQQSYDHARLTLEVIATS